MMKIDLEKIQANLDAQKQIIRPKSGPPHSQPTFSPDEQKLVSGFFAAMRTQWGKAKYDSQFGEGDDVKFAKRHWAPRIIQHSAEQLQAMLNAADSQRISGNAKFDWPDPAAILSLASNAWERQAHKPYQSDRGIEDLTAKDSRKREGLEQIKKLMAGAQVPEKKSRDHGDWYKRVEADTQKWVADCRTAYARVRARIEDTQAASDYYYDIHWEEIKKRYGVPKK